MALSGHRGAALSGHRGEALSGHRGAGGVVGGRREGRRQRVPRDGGASPRHVLGPPGVTTRLQDRPTTPVGVTTEASGRRGALRAVTRGPLRLRPLPSALSSPGRHRRRSARSRARAVVLLDGSCAGAERGPYGCCPLGQVVGAVRSAGSCGCCPSGQVAGVEISGALTLPHGRRGAEGKGRRWRGPRVTARRAPRRAMISVVTRAGVVGRSTQAGSYPGGTEHVTWGGAAVARDPVPSAPRRPPTLSHATRCRVNATWFRDAGGGA